jgi:protein SCO1/2
MRKLLILLPLLFTACARPPEFRTAVYGSPAPPPSFSLPATTGETFTLNENTAGKVTLLFFGYTACPDTCPQTLGTVRAALGKMDEADRALVQFIFITVDPRRDTLEVMTGYLARFDSGYIGVLPTEEELVQLKADYGAYSEPEGSGEDYLVGHTGLTYVLDKQGNLRLGFFDGTSSDDMAHDLTILVRE